MVMVAKDFKPVNQTDVYGSTQKIRTQSQLKEELLVEV